MKPIDFDYDYGIAIINPTTSNTKTFKVRRLVGFRQEPEPNDYLMVWRELFLPDSEFDTKEPFLLVPADENILQAFRDKLAEKDSNMILREYEDFLQVADEPHKH